MTPTRRSFLAGLAAFAAAGPLAAFTRRPEPKPDRWYVRRVQRSTGGPWDKFNVSPISDVRIFDTREQARAWAKEWGGAVYSDAHLRNGHTLT